MCPVASGFGGRKSLGLLTKGDNGFFPPRPARRAYPKSASILMKKLLSSAAALLLATCGLLALSAGFASAQIPAAPSPTGLVYRAHGAGNGPFSVEVIDARRGSGQTLVLRLALRNDGTVPLAPMLEFANPSAAARTPADARRITGLHLVDPNGQKRFEVLRDAAGVPQCSEINPPLVPGERRELSATFPAPPPTSNTVNVFFPNTTQAIVGVPIGLSTSGEPIPANAPLTPNTATGAAAPSPPAAVSASTPPAASAPESNYKPNVFPNQLPGSAAASDAPKKAIGHIQASNSDVPFTVEVLSLRRAADGHLDLRITLRNDSTGPLDVGNYFTGGSTDSANARRISGVYLLEPATKMRYEVARDGQNRAQCSEVNPPLGPGEKRELSARLAAPPTTNAPPPRSLYLYFPQASPIADVPVGQ